MGCDFPIVFYILFGRFASDTYDNELLLIDNNLIAKLHIWAGRIEIYLHQIL